MNNTNQYKQGFSIKATDAGFMEALSAAVDYRGDTTIELKSGDQVEGFLFNFEKNILDVFPKDQANKVAIPLAQVAGLSFSGKDTADGKSWEAWMAKKAAEKAAKK